jgi:hypothetical protein
MKRKPLKLLKKFGVFALLLAFMTLSSSVSFAATSPSLGTANTFGILASTYTNTDSGPPTTINGDLGYTTGPAVAPTVSGNTHVANGTYNQAGIDQGSALSALASQPCTFNFAPGDIDLATDTTHGTIGVYAPGVYCITGAASVGGGGTITLTGGGTYIFRMTGALTTSANSIVTMAGGASACDIWWTPGAATTLGANSTFAGTDIDASGITIGNLVTWTGKALAFGGTVSTTRDTINVPTCASTGPTSSAPDSGSGSSGTGTPGLPNTGGSALKHALYTTNDTGEDSFIKCLINAKSALAQ